MTPHPPSSKPVRIGRPPKNPLDSLRTQFWFQYVKRRSGLPSAYAIEMALDGERIRKYITDVARPRRWNGYEKGTNIPIDKPGSRNAIEQAEIQFPGTARYFRSPMWAYLRGESFYPETIDNHLRQLDPYVIEILFEPKPREGENQTRQRAVDGATASQLIHLGSFDALVANVLLVALSDAIASPALRKIALDGYTGLQQILLQASATRPLYEKLFSLIDQRCTHWTYLSPNQRLNVFIPWQGVQDFAEKNPDSIVNIITTDFDIDGL